MIANLSINLRDDDLLEIAFTFYFFNHKKCAKMLVDHGIITLRIFLVCMKVQFKFRPFIRKILRDNSQKKLLIMILCRMENFYSLYCLA